MNCKTLMFRGLALLGMMVGMSVAAVSPAFSVGDLGLPCGNSWIWMTDGGSGRCEQYTSFDWTGENPATDRWHMKCVRAGKTVVTGSCTPGLSRPSCGPSVQGNGAT